MFAPPIHDCSSCALGSSSPGRCPFTPVAYPSGALIRAKGEDPSTVLFIRDGLVSVGSRGKGAVYFVRGPGSLLNSEAIVGARADYEIRALTDARICLLDASTVRNWMGNERTPAQAIALLSLEQLATQGADLNARQGSCVSRVARFAVELQRARAEGTAAHLDKRVVARILGMRPETLSRALTRLQQSGALKRSPPFTIGDAELLAKAAA